jgi:hypothetical protein
MRLTFSLLIVAAAVAPFGCATLIGFPDYGTSGSTTATGTAGATASSASSTGTGGSAPACHDGDTCYLGLDGTEGVGPCQAGTVMCSGSTSICHGDIRPDTQSCSGPASEAACLGVPGCTGQFRWSASGSQANLAGANLVAVAAGLDGTVAVAGNTTSGTPGVFLSTFDARGRACGAPPPFNGGGQLGATGVALLGAKRSADQNLEQLICGAGGNGRAASTIVVGNATGTVTFAGQQQTANATDGFIVSIDPKDNVVWGRIFGSPGDDATNAVATDPSGAIYVTGALAAPLTVLPCTGTLDGGLPGGMGLFVARVESDGSCGWVKVFSGTGVGTSIAVDGNGNVVVAGTLGTMIDFGGGHVLTNAQGNAFIARLTPTTGDFDAALPAGCLPGVNPYVAAAQGGDAFLLCTIEATACGGGTGPTSAILAHIDPQFKGGTDVCFSSPSADVTAEGIAADHLGNIVVLLTSQGPVHSMGFTNGAIPVGGVVVFKLTPPFTGPYAWGTTFGPMLSFGPDYAVAVDRMGDAVVVTNPKGPVSTGPVNLMQGGAVVELAP